MGYVIIAMYRGDEAGVAVSAQRGSGMGPWGRRGLARIQRCRAPSDAAMVISRKWR